MIERRIYTVGQVSQYLKLYLESDPLLADVWVSGEMSNYRRYSSGHQYFTMKDSSGQLRCVLFRSSDMGVALEDGVSVVAHGRFSLYEARGDLQFYVDLVQPEGMGILHLEFLRLKAKLEEEGLFDSSRKRPIPEWPRRVGVITSPDGAVLHDIINIARRRYPLVELVVAPTQVQGDGAVDGITRAFRNMNSLDNIDLVILARGGGSLEELWPFNEETVARAIYGSRAPVISAVGHETDWTIADYVADLRAPTPSAAAELALPNVGEMKATVLEYSRDIRRAALEFISYRRVTLHQSAARIKNAAPDFDRRRQRIDESTRLLLLKAKGVLAQERGLLGHSLGRLQGLSPQDTLARGFAIVQHAATGVVVSKTAQVHSGDPISVQVSDGSFSGVVAPDAKGPSRAKGKRQVATVRGGSPQGEQMSLAV